MGTGVPLPTAREEIPVPQGELGPVPRLLPIRGLLPTPRVVGRMAVGGDSHLCVCPHASYGTPCLKTRHTLVTLALEAQATSTWSC